MTLILKIALIIVNIALSGGMVISAFCAMKNQRSTNDYHDVDTYKNFFVKSVIIGIVAKLFYWLVIPDVNRVVSYLIMLDIFVCVIIILMAFFFMLPLPFLKSENDINSPVSSSVMWIAKSSVAILAYFVLAYFISAPISF